MTSASANIRRLAIECSDGVALRAELALPAEGPAKAAVVLCHPHPLHGGSMYSHVIGALFDGFPSIGVAALRFNFRGTSGSEGRHDRGRAEQLDVAAAIETATDPVNQANGGAVSANQAAARLPLLLIGYSFGADVALAVSHPLIGAWLAIAPPLRIVRPDDMAAATDDRHKRIVSGSEDEFCPPDQARSITGGWPTTTITTLPGQNHFLATAAPDVLAIAEAEMRSLLNRAP